jgi:murein DD-endopeptidase MepM/ murein hydrolase activator NlpD
MVLPRKPKPPKPDKPTGPSGPTAPTGTTAATGPTGPAPAYVIGSYGNASIDQWDQAFISASEVVFRLRGVRVDPHVLKAIMDVETGGNGNYPPDRCRPSDGTDSVPACGPMQIKHAYHRYRCPECNFQTVPGQIELAAHIIGMTMKERATDEYGALRAVYFPTDDVNGTTQKAYVDRIRSLIRTMERDAGREEPEPRDVVDAILNGAATDDSYGFKHPTDLPYYAYFEGHGGNANQHTGIDATTRLGQPLFSPIAGTVVCGGTGNGAGAWGQGCAAIGDTLGRGAGRVEILAEDGRRSLILGHVSRSLVRPGDKILAGQQVAEAGGMNGPHVHIEAREWDGRQYWIRDPRALFGRGKPVVSPTPYNWNAPDRNEFVVTADIDGIVARQRADPTAPKLYDVKKGATFNAIAMIPGNDSATWWLATDSARVPIAGTRYEVKVG